MVNWGFSKRGVGFVTSWISPVISSFKLASQTLGWIPQDGGKRRAKPVGAIVMLLLGWGLAAPVGAEEQLQWQPEGTTVSVPTPDLQPLDLAFLQSSDRLVVDCPEDVSQLMPGLVLTPETICQNGLTPPSLWWMKEQFEAQSPQYKKLITTWLTYLPEGDRQGRVDLVVELQRWTIMDYFSRYEFIYTLGGEASRSGYNTRFFNLRGEFLGAYTCGSHAEDTAQEIQQNTGKNTEQTLGQLDPDRCHILINRVARILPDLPSP